jgi:hypothetical protein
MQVCWSNYAPASRIPLGIKFVDGQDCLFKPRGNAAIHQIVRPTQPKTRCTVVAQYRSSMRRLANLSRMFAVDHCSNAVSLTLPVARLTVASALYQMTLVAYNLLEEWTVKTLICRSESY